MAAGSWVAGRSLIIAGKLDSMLESVYELQDVDSKSSFKYLSHSHAVYLM